MYISYLIDKLSINEYSYIVYKLSYFPASVLGISAAESERVASAFEHEDLAKARTLPV